MTTKGSSSFINRLKSTTIIQAVAFSFSSSALAMTVSQTLPPVSDQTSAGSAEMSSNAPNPQGCISRFLLEKRLPDGENIEFIIPANGEALVSHLDNHTSLYIPRSGGAAQLRDRSEPQRKRDRKLTVREQKIVALVAGGGAEAPSVADLIATCQSIPERDTRIPLRLPLSVAEITQCEKIAAQLRELKNCTTKDDCPAVYQKYYKDGERREPATFSFRKLVETGNGEISPKMVALGAASATAYLWDFTVVRSIFQNQASLILRFGKTGVYVGGAGATVASFLFLPATAYVFGKDTCQKPTSAGEIDFADCIGKTAVQLTPVFQRQIQQAIHSPAEFSDSIERPEAAVESRLACMMLENITTAYDQMIKGMRCEGQTLKTATGESYLIKNNGDELLRHQDNFYSFRFHLKDQGRITVENRRAGNPKYHISAKLEDELASLQILKPRLNEVAKACLRKSSENPAVPLVPSTNARE